MDRHHRHVVSTLTATIPAHGTAIWRVTPGSGCATAVPTGQISGNGAKCVDVTSSGTADGTPVILYPAPATPNQRWTRPGDGTVQTLGKCLTASGTTAGARPSSPPAPAARASSGRPG